jgi:outer membrane receptor protein involved in Fe transport
LAVRIARWAATAAVVVLAVGAADIAHAENFNVPPGRLGEVATALALQGGVTIAVADPELAARRSPGVRGNYSMAAALALALRGTDAEAAFYGGKAVRIVRRVAAPATAPRPEPAGPSADAERTVAEIIVTASKQQMLLGAYPGSVKLVELDPSWVGRNAGSGTAAITKLLPAIGSTDLGPGRNKLFIRGVADSSFTGPTQATAGQYLGDVRLNYNAPDPDLNLYDMKRIEVLVGPQGTLYGASSLGGVIRLVPNAPDTHALAATLSAGVSSTRFGGTGADGAAMVNLPLLDGRLAVRIVAYSALQAGYIDDPARGKHDINSSASAGQRLTLRADDLHGWTVDLGFVLQNIATGDGQYTLRGDPPLTRNNLIAQPFHNDYRLLYATGRRKLADRELVSTSSMVWHHLTTVFDATGRNGSLAPERFEEDNRIKLFSHETRISGGGERTPWVAGVAALFNESVLSRTLGPPDAPANIAGVANVQAELAVFGQFSRRLTPTLTATMGERVAYDNITGVLIHQTGVRPPETTRHTARFSATLAFDWRPAGPLSAFLHCQQGSRAGGLAVGPTESGSQGGKFVADDMNMYEIGFRLGNQPRDRLSVQAAVFAADWAHIQADLIDTSGLPYTTNIGRGRITGVDAEITWRMSSALTLNAAAFVNDSKLISPAPGFATANLQSLPNVARGGGRATATWRKDLIQGVNLGANASLRYVGPSVLGVGPFLGRPQGDYFVADLGAQIDFGRFAFTLDVANVGDRRANTFAFGNPFDLARRDQLTPLQPRTVRLGVDARF